MSSELFKSICEQLEMNKKECKVCDGKGEYSRSVPNPTGREILGWHKCSCQISIESVLKLNKPNHIRQLEQFPIGDKSWIFERNSSCKSCGNLSGACVCGGEFHLPEKN